MKKAITLLLTLCLLLGLLPAQALAYAGDIYRAEPSSSVRQVRMEDGSLSLQNGYVHVTLNKLYAHLTVAPAAKPDEALLWNGQTPYCNYITYKSGVPTTEGVQTTLKSMAFVSKTPNGTAKAIKAEYDLLTANSHIPAEVTVYYEIVQLKESGKTANDTWGVLATVGNIKINKDRNQFPYDLNFTWGYRLNGFTGMGHKGVMSETGGPAIKISRTTVPKGENPKITTESTTITAPVEKLRTKTVPKGYSQWGDVDGVYITEAYVDSYPWANPFVGLSDYYGKNITAPSGSPIRVDLAQTVSIQPGDKPSNSRVICESYPGFDFDSSGNSEHDAHFLWGFRNLKTLTQEVPSKPDEVSPSIHAKRLAAFADSKGVTVEYVADDAALHLLKQQYGSDPVALISGDYKSENGEAFTFTNGAALLSPSVAATWAAGGKLIIHKDGRVEQSGVHLSAPSFKFYQPKADAADALKITLTNKGFAFEITPEKNDAIVYVDIPYTTVKLEKATADASGNLVFAGEIGFKTIFDGAEFSLEKLGYGLKGNDFKVNGVHAKGNFDTQKMLSLELAKVNGEVNTFKGEECYAFEMELNVFDLFETEAELELVRSKRDGSLLPNTLYFYVASSPGIPLIPPVPVGQLNGGGAGFKDLAATVNGNYWGIPPIKLRGTLKGTYLHLIEGKGDVVIGPSEISLVATDVGIVGVGKSGQIIESFGYALKLNGQERKYKGTTYEGIYLVGSEALALNLPSKTLDIIVLDSFIDLGAFGGVDKGKNNLYLGIGANGIVDGKVQIPKDTPLIGGIALLHADVNVIVGGQTTVPIRGVSVSEGMQQAFQNVDVYLGAKAQSTNWLYDARVWVLLPNIIETNFKKGKGWDIEGKLFVKLPEWNWAEHGVTPVVQAVLLEDGEEFAIMPAAEPLDSETGAGENSEETTVSGGENSKETTVSGGEKSEETTVSGGENLKETTVSGGENSKEATVRGGENLKETTVGGGENSEETTVRGGENSEEITVSAGTDETPYILLAFDSNVSEEKIKNALKIQKDGNSIDINWVGKDGEIDSNSEINAGTDLIMNNKDEQEYRMVLLRLKHGGTYQVNTGLFEIQKHQKATVTPFEKLDLSLSGERVSGKIAYAEKNTNYVLRTYLGSAKGEADYLVDEQIVANPQDISVTIPTSGTLMPSGKYYATSFLMMEKEFDLEGRGKKTALMAIDSQKFDSSITYTNSNEPAAPANVSLEFIGNEVMRASWGAVGDANGYRVTIYQRDGNDWKDTGFGYDLDTTTIDMALTVGGKGTEKSKNLSANETYKIGVSAYKEETYFTENTETGTAEGEEATAKKALTAKYYSKEAQSDSNGVLLPKYKPLNITLTVNGKDCTKDENGVFHTYVGGGNNSLTVEADGASGITVTRMDTNKSIAADASNPNSFAIPDFAGSLMFKVEGKQDKDVTDVFLLVSHDETPSLLTLSDPIFFADSDTGAYTVTGTADAGSEILYGKDGSTRAEGDGSFAISGTLHEKEDNATLRLSAKDSAGNESAPQLALVARRAGGYSGGGGGGGGGGSRSGGKTSYSISGPSGSENGSVSISPQNAAEGERVTITVVPKEGYALEGLAILDQNGKEIASEDKGNGEFMFTMPASKVEIKAVFEPISPEQEGRQTVVQMQIGSKLLISNGAASQKDAAPVIRNNRALVPIRFITEALGGEVKWNEAAKEVILVMDGKEIRMTIGKALEKYGVAPIIIDGRTYVPVRFVADELKAMVAWDNETKTVTITRNLNEK